MAGKKKKKEVMRKKVFAIILSLCMVLTMMPAVAWAKGIVETKLVFSESELNIVADKLTEIQSNLSQEISIADKETRALFLYIAKYTNGALTKLDPASASLVLDVSYLIEENGSEDVIKEDNGVAFSKIEGTDNGYNVTCNVEQSAYMPTNQGQFKYYVEFKDYNVGKAVVKVENSNLGGSEEAQPQIFISPDGANKYGWWNGRIEGVTSWNSVQVFLKNNLIKDYEIYFYDPDSPNSKETSGKFGTISKNGDGTFTFTPNGSGEKYITIEYGGQTAPFTIFVPDSQEPENPGDPEEQVTSKYEKWFFAKKKVNGDNKVGYERISIPDSDSDVKTPMWFVSENGNANDQMYLLREKDGFSGDLNISCRRGNLNSVSATYQEDYTDGQTTYRVWKITAIYPDNFDCAKLNFQSGSDSIDAWILGEDYKRADNNFNRKNIVLISDIPENKTWSDFNDLNADENIIKDNRFYLDMSQEATSDRNSFYVIYDANKTLNVEATQYFGYELDGTSLNGVDGGKFEKILNAGDILTIGVPFPVSIGGGVPQQNAVKVSLNEYLGYENIRLSFTAGPDSCRMELYMGTTIKFTGEKEGVTAVRDSNNILNEVLGFDSVTDEFNLSNGEAFFDKAHATFSEEGQGLVCGFDVKLAPGYVIDYITSGNDAVQYRFLVRDTYYYNVYDENGNLINKSDTDWEYGISSSNDAGEHREAFTAEQVVAVHGLEVEELDESVTAFKNFLDNNGYTAERIGAYVDYTIMFDQSQSTEPHSIVFNVSRPEDFRGSKIDIHGKNNIKIDINEVIDFDKTRGNDNIAQLCEDGWEIEKIYEIGAADSGNSNNAITNANGLVNITISETELSGNPEDYIVVYFTDEGVPMEMPTTYVEGQGIVFTTGHFSKYAVVNKTGATDSAPNPGTPGVGLPSVSPTDPTQSGTTTTTDLSGSTVSKGGETTTTVDQSTADKLVEKATANKSEEIVISAVTKNQSAASSTKSAEVTLPAETLSAIAEKTDADVVIKTDVAEVKLDNEAAEAIAQQAQASAETEGKAETVSIITEKVKEEAQEVSFELKVVTSSGKVISDFNGGSVRVTVNVPKSLSNKKLVCIFIDENGLKHKVDGQLNSDGTYTFTTGHFSTYAIMSEEDAEKAIKDQKEAIKAIKFKLRSQLVKTKSGKKAVKLTWTNPSDIEFEGVAIYRSTKKNTGYGKKPIHVSKSDKYINTAVKSGKKYYYKVRAFVTIDGEKVYTDYSYKAYRTVK